MRDKHFNSGLLFGAITFFELQQKYLISKFISMDLFIVQIVIFLVPRHTLYRQFNSLVVASWEMMVQITEYFFPLHGNEVQVNI